MLPKGFRRKHLTELEFHVLQEIVLLHVGSVVAGKTVGEALKEVENSWWTCLKRLDSGDIHVGLNWVANHERLKWWGKLDAKLQC